MNLVIVESPAKAKTINKYLGDNYTVLASYGHIRDLPSKNGSVDPDQNFKMEWEVDSFSKKYLKEITDAAKDSSKIILATDPDREGGKRRVKQRIWIAAIHPFFAQNVTREIFFIQRHDQIGRS